MTYTLTYSVRDGKGQTGVFTVRVGEDEIPGDVIAFAIEFAGMVEAMINGVIDHILFSFRVPYVGANEPGLTSDVEEILYMVSKDTTGISSKYAIPTINELFVLPGTSEIDRSAPEVAALITALENGVDIGGGTIVAPTSARGNDIVEVVEAIEKFRSKRKKRKWLL